MSSTFYTNVQSLGNHILYRGIKDGMRIKTKVEYAPSLYIPTKKQTAFRSLEGGFLERKRFDGIREAKEYSKRFGEELANGTKIYGQTRYEYAYIGDQHPKGVEYNFDLIDIDIIDIEVGSENGFPDPYIASETITAIALKRLNGHMYVWGLGDFRNDDEKNVTYYKCQDEYSLCKLFLNHWTEHTPDILTGWNTDFFDIPYLVNRFKKILGDKLYKSLSPWNYISEREVTTKQQKVVTQYTLTGVTSLDYLELYRTFEPRSKQQENHRLDTVANSEVGEGKLSYEEYESLHQLYKLNHQLFIEYNIKDAKIIEKLEDKLKLLELAVSLAFDTRSNFSDVFTQTRMWDALTYCYLLERGIIVPPREVKTKDAAFEGAYVKEVQAGLHDWVASFDLNSLYPHLIMQYNISPETLIQPEDYTPQMREVLRQHISVNGMLAKEVDTSLLAGQNVTMTPNGQFFRTDKIGFLPEILEGMYLDRKKFKKMMLEAKQELEDETDKSKNYEIKKRIAKFSNIEKAKKVGLNSAYGALGSQYFRFYDLRMALGVTTAGQLSIRWIEDKVNAYMNRLVGSEGVDYIIASDTDSIYLRMGELVKKYYAPDRLKTIDRFKVIDFMDRICEDRMQPYINESYRELAEYVHAARQKMEMKREGLSDRGIWTAKKRYILNVYDNEGVRYKEPDLKIMGMEMIKSSTPAVVRTAMLDLVKLMMTGTEKDVQSFVTQFREDFKKLTPEEISFPRGVNGINKYIDQATLYKKGTPAHVRGSILYNRAILEKKLDRKFQKIQEGEKIKFTYLKMPNPMKDDVISYPTRLPPEFGVHKYVDYDTQFEKTFMKPMNAIVSSIGWKTEKVDSIEDFFM